MIAVNVKQPNPRKTERAEGVEVRSSQGKVVSGPDRDSGPDIFIDNAVLTRLSQACQEAANFEGFLGGQLVFSRFRPVLVIEQLYFYPLTSPRRQLDADYMENAKEFFAEELPDAKLLGWFSMRSHQELGLSTHDLLLTQMFFGEHWQVAVLVDKQNGDCTVYSWQNGAFQPSRRVRVIATQVAEEAAELKDASSIAEKTPMPLGAKLVKKLPWQRIALGVVLFLLVVVAAAAFSRKEPSRYIGGALTSSEESLSSLQESSESFTVVSGGEGGSAISQLNASAERALGERSSSQETTERDGPTVSVTPVAAGTAMPNTIEYTVMPGDTLWELSQRFLGQPSRYQEIVKANPQITDPNRLSAGIVLRIPIDPDLR